MQQNARKRARGSPATKAPPPRGISTHGRAGIRARENLTRRLPKRSALSGVVTNPRSLTVAGAAQAWAGRRQSVAARGYAAVNCSLVAAKRRVAAPVSRSTLLPERKQSTRCRARPGRRLRIGAPRRAPPILLARAIAGGVGEIPWRLNCLNRPGRNAPFSSPAREQNHVARVQNDAN